MRVITLSVQRKIFLNQFSLFSWILASFFIFSACNNISSNLNRLPSSLIDQSDPTTGNGGAFQLYSVNPDLASPGTIYDMIGQNQEFDTYCGGSLGSCMCEYSFNQPGVGSQTVSAAVTYQESNLIRCPNSVPSGITSFDARITVVASGTTVGTPAPGQTGGAVSYSSNTITVNLSANGAFAGSTSYMDLTNASTYVPVQRFQCRKREFIVNPLDNLIIDPIQSGDPAVIYPFNYYTTNVSESLLKMQQSGSQSWECSLSATQDRSLQWWANPNVFSSAACNSPFCSGDDYLMYPQTSLSSGRIPVRPGSTATGKRRSSFSLASVPYGVFQIPLKAAVAPLNYVSSNYSVIGYAAKPIPGTNGSSACPAIAIPPNATWVKLWNYRATDITSPKIVTANQGSANSVVACDTGHGSNLFPSCEVKYAGAPGSPVSGGGNSFGVPLSGIGTGSDATDPLASRILLLAEGSGSAQTSACYKVDHNQWAVSTFNAQDKWTPSPFGFDATVTKDTIAGFPYNMYTDVRTWAETFEAAPTNYRFFKEGAFAGTYGIFPKTPQDFKTQLTTVALSDENYTDQLFITSDPNVDDSLMRNGASSVAHYIPSTYRSFQACPGANPLACASSTPLNWRINVKEVGNPTSMDTYPLCVLQFYD